MRGTSVRRRPVTDRVDRDGAAVVLVGRSVVRLSPLATHLFDGCATWTDLDALTDHLVTQFGPPVGDDPRRATASAIDALVAQGLLESRSGEH